MNSIKTAYQLDHEKAVRAIEVAAEFTPELKEAGRISPAGAIDLLAYLLAHRSKTEKSELIAPISLDVGDERTAEERVVKYIEQLDNGLKALAFTHEQRMQIVGLLVSPETYKNVVGVTEGVKAPESVAPTALSLEQFHAWAAQHKMALVPMHITRGMQEVMEDEGWSWEDLLAAAESITEEQYAEISEGIEASKYRIEQLERLLEAPGPSKPGYQDGRKAGLREAATICESQKNLDALNMAVLMGAATAIRSLIKE